MKQIIACFQTSTKANPQQYKGIQRVVNKANQLPYAVNVVATCFRLTETITRKLEGQDNKVYFKDLNQHYHKHGTLSPCQKRKETS